METVRLDKAEKITAWKNEPSVQDLKQDLEIAQEPQQTQIAKIERWNNLRDVSGEARPKKIKGRSSVQPKLVRRQAEWRYPALTEPFLSTNHVWSVKPVSYVDVDAARQNQLVLNWQFQTKINKVKFIDDFVRSTVDDGTCIVRVGWKRVTTKVTNKAPVYTHIPLAHPDHIEKFRGALEMSQNNPEAFDAVAHPAVKAAIDYYNETGEATHAEQTGEQDVTDEHVLENRPTVEVLNPENVFIDPTCNGDFSKALFVVVSFETNKSELERDGNYVNLDEVDWEGSTPMNQPNHVSEVSEAMQFRDAARKKVVAYEYHGFYDVNGDGELIPILATWIGNVMVRMEESPFPDGKLPFVVVPYTPVKRALYGEPDAELLEDNQNILGAVTRGMIDLMGRSANAQQGFAKGMLDPINRRRYDEGRDYEFNPSVSPAQGIIEHKYPEIPQSAMLMLNLQNQEGEALTGVKSFSGGISGESYGDVAAGIRGVLDAASKREMSILRRLAQGMKEIGEKIIAMNAEFLSDEEVVALTNEEFVSIHREDLPGDFHLEVDITTAENDAAKSQDLGFILQTVGPNAGPEITMMVLSEITRLKRMPELTKKLQDWKPTPDPIAQQLAQLDLQIKAATLKKLEAETQLALSKANHTEANAQSVAVSTQDQVTGVAHARDMQKMAAQAEGNQSLEVTKALLGKRKADEIRPDIEAAIGFNRMSQGFPGGQQ